MLDSDAMMMTASEPLVARLQPMLLADTYGTVILVVGFVILAVALAGVWAASKSMPKGTMLAIGFVAIVISAVINPGNVRELHALTGFTRMFGVIALILGLVDLFRKRAA